MAKEKMGCPAAKKCGGCNGCAGAYDADVKRKEEQVRKLFSGICNVERIVPMDNPLYYRCKVNASFAFVKGKGIISGPYEESTHRIVPVDNCLIESQIAGAIIKDIKKLLPSFKIRCFDEKTGYGLLRHVLIRVGKNTGQVMVVLVLTSPILPSKNNFVKALREKHPEISTVVLNVNDRFTSMVLGNRNIVLYGKGYIQDSLCDLTFRISPSSFYQVNPVQAEKIYNAAITLAELTGKEKVIDAYCGTGTIGCVAAKSAGSVLGIEVNKDAVRDAIENAKENHLKNISFVAADATEYLSRLAMAGEKADVILMDPPRSGSTAAFIKAAASMKPSRIIYVSCDPVTLVRDVKEFRRFGYEASFVRPYDMFPFTEHVETIALLSRETC